MSPSSEQSGLRELLDKSDRRGREQISTEQLASHRPKSLVLCKTQRSRGLEEMERFSSFGSISPARNQTGTTIGKSPSELRCISAESALDPATKKTSRDLVSVDRCSPNPNTAMESRASATLPASLCPKHRRSRLRECYQTPNISTAVSRPPIVCINDASGQEISCSGAGSASTPPAPAIRFILCPWRASPPWGACE